MRKNEATHSTEHYLNAFLMCKTCAEYDGKAIFPLRKEHIGR